MKLTKDEIMLLEGRELDAAVAEYIFGQTDFTHQKFCWTEGWILTGADGWDGYDGYYCSRCGAEEEDEDANQIKCCKPYSTSWDAMREVMEHTSFVHFQIDRADDRGNKWYASCATIQNAFSIFADKAGIAVCRAALLAVMGDTTS